MRTIFRAFATAGVLLALGAGSAGAAPDASGSSTITEPDFGLYTVTKTYEVYTASNVTNPLPLAGNYTYIYTLTNQPGSFTCLITFEMEVPSSSVTAAGFIPGAGVAPSSTVIGATVVEWHWTTPNLICPGQTSEQLYVHSPYGPGTVNDNIVSIEDEFAFDAQSTCVGPHEAPVGEAMPCTIGFWKNRADGKQGTLQWFPNGDFDALVTAAVALSNGVFANEAELLFYLQSKGPRPIDVRAKQQLAATLLNLAAGDLFPENQKCKLFEGNLISSNDCGTGITVGYGVSYAINDLGGPIDEIHEAHECLDDLNNGIGVE